MINTLASVAASSAHLTPGVKHLVLGTRCLSLFPGVLAEVEDCCKLGLMPRAKKQSKDIDDLVIATEKAFQFIQKKMATKEDLKRFATKEDLDKRLEGMEDRIVTRVTNAMDAKWENREEDLQGSHEDELASVEGKKAAPVQWKSMPRRLKTVEHEVEKIKDHLHFQSKS